MNIDVNTVDEIQLLTETIFAHLDESLKRIRALEGDPFEAAKRMPFDKIGIHPIEYRELNFVEQLNQTFTYLVALKATGFLLREHPEAGGSSSPWCSRTARELRY